MVVLARFDIAAYIRGAQGFSATYGYGLWITGAGGCLAVLFGIIAAFTRRDAAAADPAPDDAAFLCEGCGASYTQRYQGTECEDCGAPLVSV